MKKNKRPQLGFFSAVALALGTMATPAYQANASINSQTQNVRGQENREALPKERNIVKPVSRLNEFGLSGVPNPYKYIETPKSNQRQKRKHWRQCPHMRPK